jgi:hypothetical protein
MIRPAIETALAALLVAGALYLLIFGPGEALMGLYGPASPERADPGYPGKVIAAVAALLPGLWFAVGVWAGYPGWRTALLSSILIASAWVVWIATRTLLF